MQVNDIMVDPVTAVAEDESLRRAAGLMAERGRSVLAVERRDVLVGTVGQRELALACAAGRPPEETPVSQIMRTHIASCSVDADLRAALAQMTDEGVDALLVRSPKGTVIGLLTRLRVLEALAFPDDEPRGPAPEYVHRVRGEPS
jgi:CBS domain-containing protein